MTETLVRARLDARLGYVESDRQQLHSEREAARREAARLRAELAMLGYAPELIDAVAAGNDR